MNTEILQSKNYDLVNTLQTFSIFNGVSEGEFDKLAEQGIELHFKKGTQICHEGQKSEIFYLILHGMVSIHKVSSNGKESIIDCRYTGDILGWGQVIHGGYFTASYYALYDTRLLAFKKDDFLDFLNRNEFMKSRIADLSIDLINNLYDKLMDILSDTAKNRLIKTLMLLYSKSGGTIILTHLDIAKMSWTTPETATRVLSRLKSDKIIITGRGKFFINKPEQLCQYLEKP